ncbi:transporter substrate-binding protein [Paracoccus cavernae]|uniref:transporter substrate-binding protein n=1 Tax=Paracoccus cavernae TaxID=1571207 RepID=UPI0035F3D5FB
MKRIIEIGVLLSRSGTYEPMSRATLAGVLRGIDEVSADMRYGVDFAPVVRDPAGDLANYSPMCQELLGQQNIRHIFGCVTSASRKEVIPALERHGGVLWYPLPYEGFEASEHIAYMHACPNQHVVPLLEWAAATLGPNAYLVGSNYIWGWEIARIARERILASGGRIMGDRYQVLNDTSMPHILDEIARLKPDFILNSLVGESAYHFFAELAKLRAASGGAVNPAVLSCNFTEAELSKTGSTAEGLISVGPWFAPAPAPLGNSFAEMARRSVHELAQLLTIVPDGEHLPLSALVNTAAKRGYVSLLAGDTLHAKLPVVIARLEGQQFMEIKRLSPRAADPYLSRSRFDGDMRPSLRVVS